MKHTNLPPYSRETMLRARELRKNLTSTEWAVWNHIRDKKTGVKFRRQVPIGHYIADFFSMEIGLVIEIDGSQHLDVKHQKKDQKRTKYFESFGIKVIRFNNVEVATNIDGVYEEILRIIQKLKK